jgi:hypothetical protein
MTKESSIMFDATTPAAFKIKNPSDCNDGLLRLRTDQRLINRIVSLASGGQSLDAAEPPAALQSEIAGLSRAQLLGLIEFSAALIMLSD